MHLAGGHILFVCGHADADLTHKDLYQYKAEPAMNQKFIAGLVIQEFEKY